MTEIAAGGIEFDKYRPLKRFSKELSKLDPQLREKVQDKLSDLLQKPQPPGLGFEKLKGYRNPNVYTVHVTGNYKISLEVVREDGHTIAVLRRIGCHDEIDRRA